MLLQIGFDSIVNVLALCTYWLMIISYLHYIIALYLPLLCMSQDRYDFSLNVWYKQKKTFPSSIISLNQTAIRLSIYVCLVTIKFSSPSRLKVFVVSFFNNQLLPSIVYWKKKGNMNQIDTYIRGFTKFGIKVLYCEGYRFWSTWGRYI